MKYLFLFSILMALLILSCSPSPEPIEFGKDKCSHCSMTISDKRFGAELVTNKSKIYKFDSIECLAAYYLNFSKEEIENIHSLWTVNYTRQNDLLDVQKSSYVRSQDIHSPMGLNIASFADMETARKFKNSERDTLLYWGRILEIVRNEW